VLLLGLLRLLAVSHFLFHFVLSYQSGHLGLEGGQLIRQGSGHGWCNTNESAVEWWRRRQGQRRK